MKYHLVPWNSMELWDAILWHFTLVGLPRDIPWNSMELWSRHTKKSPTSMGFRGIRRAPFQMTQIFHGIPLNIPWNSMELWCHQMTNRLVPWNSMEHSMSFSMELWCRQMKYHLVPWNSMELWDCHFMAFYPGWTSKGYSMEFHGTLESP